MASGLAATTLANKWLNMLGGTAFTAPSTFVQLHTGEPGAAGTSNVSSVTTRPAITWAAASAGAFPAAAEVPGGGDSARAHRAGSSQHPPLGCSRPPGFQLRRLVTLAPAQS